ncbi:biosynthetic peptidoglycan transglycosylase [Piscinibacter terrae]|uniref:Glycosyl transferase n=1 Tax=Piscinibacter terrae TaxID=2496871 RepID=A0A3N7HPG1_9BURK|nr:biosynthetic peptidoglycan transglycosylase [Albitalea terrae]RQP24098.1 glycosyl transferase [Albitalea terrae]
MIKRILFFMTGTLLGLLVALAAFAAVLLSLVRPTPGGWTHTLRIAGMEREVSVPAVMRMATHPVVMRALQDRDWHTPRGVVRVSAGTDPETWTLTCSSCRIPASAQDVLALDRVTLHARRNAQNEWQGDVTLGEGQRAVQGRFKYTFDDRGGEVQLQLPDTPIASVYGLFARAIPEAGKAQIGGTMRLKASIKLPQRDLRVEPFIDGFSVAGLGTEALLNTSSTCPAPTNGLGTWLPRAVVAAEDQRFYEHSGYDLREIASALSQRNTAQNVPRGASTLDQQLAKLLFTGDSRDHVRKLRELLYAVEMDRTLGKQRLLHLYLSIAPWGEGQCGAAAAAHHYLHKRVDKLTPMEAAWLASLLHNPDRDLAALARNGQVDVQRVCWVVDNLHPLRAKQREAIAEALPTWRPAASAASAPAR